MKYLKISHQGLNKKLYFEINLKAGSVFAFREIWEKESQYEWGRNWNSEGNCMLLEYSLLPLHLTPT